MIARIMTAIVDKLTMETADLAVVVESAENDHKSGEIYISSYPIRDEDRQMEKFTIKINRRTC